MLGTLRIVRATLASAIDKSKAVQRQSVFRLVPLPTARVACLLPRLQRVPRDEGLESGAPHVQFASEISSFQLGLEMV